MKYIIEKSSEQIGNRIDKFVGNIESNLTRSYVQKLLDQNMIKVNGVDVKASYKLKEGDEILIAPLIKEEMDIKAEDISLDVIYEDEDIIIINKPKNMVVHPGNGNYEGTLVNALMYSHKNSLSGINGVIRPGIVHRIDKDTTGILVIAKNDNAHKTLSDDFKKHDIVRKYIALVKGCVSKDRLLIDLPVGRDDKDRKKMSVTTKNSRNAVTHITVLERFAESGYTLVEATLETGRTHQIRVHMAHIGHPLVGDKTYGKEKNEFGVKGQLLHAKTLGFKHPKTLEYMEFEKELPIEYQRVLEILKNRERQK